MPLFVYSHEPIGSGRRNQKRIGLSTNSFVQEVFRDLAKPVDMHTNAYVKSPFYKFIGSGM